MKKILLILTALLVLSSCRADKADGTVGQPQNNNSIEVVSNQPVMEQTNSVQPTVQENNIVYKAKVKIGDKIAGLTVKSLDMSDGYLNDITFSGEVIVEGEYEWTDDTGDGEGYVFTLDNDSIKKLPTLEGTEDIDYFILINDDYVEKSLNSIKGKAKIVIDEYSLGERQIPTGAKLVRVAENIPAEVKVPTIKDTDLSAAYSNTKYNFGISYPKDWIISEEPPAGDGVMLYSDSINDIRVYGGYSLGFEEELIENARKSNAEVSDLINNKGQKGTLIVENKANQVFFHYLIIGNEMQCQFYAFISKDFYISNRDLLTDMAKSLELYEWETAANNPQQGSSKTEGELYQNGKLGFSLVIPESWNGKYIIEEEDDGIFVRFKPAEPVEEEYTGLLFAILERSLINGSEDHFDTVGEPRIFEAKGITYITGGPTDVSFPIEHKEFDDFAKMSGEVRAVVGTIKVFD